MSSSRSSSLLGSIFGNEAAHVSSGSVDADLFGGATLPPPLVVSSRQHAATAAAKMKNTSSSSEEEDDDEGDEPTQQEETSSSTIIKKTKQEIQEETQNKLQRTVFVGNLPPNITRRGLASLFASYCGKVESARLRSIPVIGIKLPPQKAGNQRLMRKVCINTGKIGYLVPNNNVLLTTTTTGGGGGGNRKNTKTTPTAASITDAQQQQQQQSIGGIAAKTCAQGYVVFEKLESVQLALSKNNTVYENRTIRVDRVVFDHDSITTADDGGGSATTIKTNITKNSVFVGNLPYGADEETLRQHFMSVLLGDSGSSSSSSSSGSSGNGEEGQDGSSIIITGVRIIRDSETQQCKGFGYIALQDGTYITDALRAHGTVYMKRELRVMICGGKGSSMKKGGGSGYYNTNKIIGGGGSRPRSSFEGQRTTNSKNHPSTTTSNNTNNNKRKFDDGVVGGRGSAVTKKRRARSEKKTTDGVGTSSKGERLSKRAATEARVKKRVKKLQQRVVKGMGKKKK